MTVPRPFARFLAVVAAGVASGCAAAYEAYPCGCVPYGYCPQAPLAWVEYAACPTPVAARMAVESTTGAARLAE